MLNHVLLVAFFCIHLKICLSTLLWRIEISPPAYIFGSIHIPYNLVWPYVSNETQQAFLSSTDFYLEVDVTNDAYWDEFFQCLIKRSKRTRRLSHSLNEQPLLDVYLSEEARRLNKTIGSLESSKYFCEKEGWRYSLTTWIILINNVKNEIKKPTSSFNNIKRYLKKSIVKKYICDEIDGEFIQSLYESKKEIQNVEQRDEEISRSIHKLLSSTNNHRYFFAIGAGHMFGNHQNLIIRLENLGYKITRIFTNQNHIKKKFDCQKKKTMKHFKMDMLQKSSNFSFFGFNT